MIKELGDPGSRSHQAMAGRPRVLYVITRFLGGGAEAALTDIVPAIRELGLHVDLAVGGESQLERLAGLPVENVHIVSQLCREVAPLRDAWALLKLYLIIRQGHYEIVHTHQSKAGILGRLAAKLAGVPAIIHTVHMNNLENNSLFTYVERLAANASDILIFVGEELRDRYINSGIVTLSKSKIIHSSVGVEPLREVREWDDSKCNEKRASLGYGSQDKLVLVVASLEPRKGHNFVLEIARQLRLCYRDAKFVLVGEGPEEDHIIKNIQSSSLGGSVRLLGYRRDVAEIMRVSDVLLLTSMAEGLPRVLVEAAAIGLPVVTFAVDGAREIVQNEARGFVVPAADVNSTVISVRKILDKPHLFGSRAVPVLEDYWWAWDTAVASKQTKQLYLDLLRKRSTSI